jgi:hypothetical protein
MHATKIIKNDEITKHEMQSKIIIILQKNSKDQNVVKQLKLIHEIKNLPENSSYHT